MNYETMHLFAMSRMERARCLTIMNEYYRLHLPDFPVLKSLEAALKEIIAETGATSGKDMGKVMGVASKKLAGLAEGRAISAKVKELLG